MSTPPKARSKSARLVSSTAWFIGPLAKKSTKAVFDVGTPVMGWIPLGISSMYSPGYR
ncbi:MAG TPA: hypothetical protein VGF54_11955 [Streptosporangiaceae bacterium]